jgi:hypothetical protein
MMVLCALETAGCGGTREPCSRRPWECAAGGAKGVGGGAAPIGSCESYVPPDYSALTENAMLPDPFLFADGTRMSEMGQWSCRRAEISAQAQKYELGAKPGARASVTGGFDGSNVVVTALDGQNSISFSAAVTYPTTGTPPYPAMIGIGGISLGATQLNAMGVATIVLPNDVVAEQKDGSSRGKGLFYKLYGSTHTAGAMMAWAWGVSRLIDAIEQTPDANIDPARLGVTGCSRNGKGALVAGAFDDRIVLTIPQESGSGGSACWRISDAQMAEGTEVQTLSQITGENVWFADLFKQFNRTAKRLPFDHHMIEGLVAPRALLIVENSSQVWLGNVSTYNCSMAAHLIWEALGIPDKMGVSQIGDHSHCQWNGSQQAEVTAYVQKYLVGGGTANTNVLKTDGGYTFDQATWVDWTVPALE